MGFWYPTHWPDIADEATAEVEVDDHGHGDIRWLSPPVVSLLDTRDRWLEDYLNTLTAGSFPPFDFPGPLVVSISDLWCPPNTLTVSKFAFTLFAASTAGSVSVEIDRNGAALATVTIPAHTLIFPFTLPKPVTLTGGTDTMQLRILGTGTAASGLVGSPA